MLLFASASLVAWLVHTKKALADETDMHDVIGARIRQPARTSISITSNNLGFEYGIIQIHQAIES